MTTKANVRSARKPAAKKTPKKPGTVLVLRPPEPTPAVRFSPVLCIVGTTDHEVWSLSPGERSKKQFAVAGLTEAVNEAMAGKHNGLVILVRANAVIDQPLIPVLFKRPNFLLLSDDAATPAPVAASVRGSEPARAADILRGINPFVDKKLLARAPSQLEVDDLKSPRELATPYATIVTPGNREAVEWRMFRGIDPAQADAITRHLWPVPGFYAARLLVGLGVTPILVRAAAVILALMAIWFFIRGQFMLGLLSAGVVAFVSPLNEALTNVTLASSKRGYVFGQIFDLVHPPLYYAAWGSGLLAGGTPWSSSMFWGVLAVIVSGHLIQSLIEGPSAKRLGLDIHTWRPIDRLLRQVITPGNPALVLLIVFAAVARPDWGLLAVAIWTMVSLDVLAVQIMQALRSKRKSGALAPRQAKP